jgi:hypothetical protein
MSDIFFESCSPRIPHHIAHGFNRGARGEGNMSDIFFESCSPRIPHHIAHGFNRGARGEGNMSDIFLNHVPRASPTT